MWYRKETQQKCIYHNILSFPHAQLCLLLSFNTRALQTFSEFKKPKKNNKTNTCFLTTVYVPDIHNSFIGNNYLSVGTNWDNEKDSNIVTDKT